MKERKRVLAFILALVLVWPSIGMTIISAKAADIVSVQVDTDDELVTEPPPNEKRKEDKEILEEVPSENTEAQNDTEAAQEQETNIIPPQTKIEEGEYTTDFSDVNDWETFQGVEGGIWTNANNKYNIDQGNGNKSLLKDRTFTNFTYEADITVNSKTKSNGDSAQGGLLFRVTKVREDAHGDGYNGYYFGIDVEKKTVILGKVLGNNQDQWNHIGTKKMTLDYGETYHLKLEVSGNHIVGYVNDVNDTAEHFAKIDMTDDSFTVDGRIGVRNWMSNVDFENVSLVPYSETAETGYTNSLIPMCADPDVLYHDGTYYLYPTNAGDANDDQGIKVYTSTDLVNWTDQGFALKKEDVWGNFNFWAPDIIERDGTFYMYYTAEEHICVATSDSPLGPFTQDIKKPLHETTKEIDAHVFEDEGKYYLYFVRFDNGNVIEGAVLNDDMKSIDESSIKRLLTPDQAWEMDKAKVNEGPYMLKKDGVYYLTYSGSHFESAMYGSGYATSDNPLGPFTKYANNPIMQSNAVAKGTGHHGIVETPAGEIYMVYHRHKSTNETEPREFCIDRLWFTKDVQGNDIIEVKGPTVTPQAPPAGLEDVKNLIKIDESKLSAITVKNGTAVSDWGLPEKIEIITSKGKENVDVAWNTSAYDKNEHLEQKLTISGTFTIPSDIKNPGNVSDSAKILVTVNEYKTEDQELQAIINQVEIKNADDIRENIFLPEEIEGYKIIWASDDESIVSVNSSENQDYYATPAGIVHRQTVDKEVKLTAKIKAGAVEAEKIIKLTVIAKPQRKPYVGYLYTHFKEFAGVKGEQDIFFGISKNGIDWTALNNNEAVLKSTVGDMKVRDPYIIRSYDGDKFYLIATDQDIYQYGNVDWDKLSTQGSQALTIWESNDLVNWENHRRVVVADSIEAGCAWAPEAIYDEVTGEYLVYWSSKVAGDNYARQYNFVSKTRDFYTFTEPELFNNLSTSNIDTSVYKEGEKYYKLVKLEDGNNTHVILQSAKEHPLAYGTEVENNKVSIGTKEYRDLGAHYTKINNSAAGCLESFKGGYEGATMFKFNDRDEWCIMVDEYGGNSPKGYIPFISKNLDAENSVKALANGNYIMQDGGKHGGMIPITQTEYDALMDKWGVAKANVLKNIEEQEKPILVYDFEEIFNGTTIENKSEVPLTESLDGKLNGTAKYQYDADKQSNVLYLDGSGYGELPEGLFDGLENVTISMDVKPETTDLNHVDFCIGQDTNRYLFLRFRNHNNEHLVDSGITVRSHQNEYKLTDVRNTLNKWTNVKIVMENHKMTMYVNNEVAYVNEHVRSIPELGQNLITYLGKAFYNDPNFKGSYDNIMVYNRALTKDEIMGDVEEEKYIVQRIEAETAELAGKAKVATNAGASGGKKVGYIDDENATVTFTLNAPTAGTYRVDLRAGSACSNASHKYYVNGKSTDAKIVNYVNSGWDNWNTYPIEVELEKGSNTFTVTHSGISDSFSELDYIDFYTTKTTIDGIAVDGQPLENFNWQKHDYEVDVANLNGLKNVTATMPEEMEELFKITVKQATTSRPEAIISVICEELPQLNQEYRIRFITPGAFTNPLVNYGADPYVTYQDGYYYYIRVLQDRELYVSKSSELSRIGQVEPVLVYKPKADEPSAEMWAPEIHYLKGKWYIYYTAGAGANHRMYVLECDSPQGTYEFKGKLTPTTDRWAIDQTVLEHDGQLYAIWSGWEGTVNVDQRIYIAKMSDPLTITGERVELSIPEYEWELHGNPLINEGAQIVKSPTGVVNIIYSASGSWTDDYCLGALTLKEGGDPMKPADWIKAQEPLLKKNMSSTYSTGHACFTTSPDGTEDYIVYHATRGSGEGWSGRGVRTQRVYWNDDGTIDIGAAIDYNSRVNLPSGTIVTPRDRYEAEDGSLSGNAQIEETYNSSGGKKVTGLTTEESSVKMNITAAKSGTYKLYVGAATKNNNAGFIVWVNGKATAEKKVFPLNSQTGKPGVCADNWTGYELEVKLNAGVNTIELSKTANLNSVDIDYIELELIKESNENSSGGGSAGSSKAADNSILKDTYQKYTDLKAEDYEEAGYNTYQQALAKAKEILNNSAATQTEIDLAQKNLQDAVNALVKKLQPSTVKTVPKKGSKKTVAGFIYQVTKSDAKNGTVTVVKPTKKTVKTVTIPATVKIDGYTFKVTTINAKAFYNHSMLTKVTIGNNVNVIGSQAFYGCKKLTSLKIGNAVTTIGTKAFYNCKMLKAITVTSQKLKTISKDAFKNTNSNLKIKVPKNQFDKYQKLFKKGGIAKNSKITK